MGERERMKNLNLKIIKTRGKNMKTGSGTFKYSGGFEGENTTPTLDDALTQDTRDGEGDREISFFSF